MTKHTPTPYSIRDLTIWNEETGKAIADCDIGMDFSPKAYVPLKDCRANAAFIIRACNAHDTLVEALNGFIENAQDGPKIAPNQINYYKGIFKEVLKLAQEVK